MTKGTRRQYPGPSVRDIAQMLRPHTEQIVRMLYPNAVKAGGFICIGSVHGESGDSLKVYLNGPKQGGWSDYGLPKGHPEGGGDLLTLFKLGLCNGNMGAAIREARNYLHLDTMDPRKLADIQRRADAAQRKAQRAKLEDDEKRRRDAEGMWIGAAPLTPSSPPVKYLASRGIDFARLGKLPGAIRFRTDIFHKESGRELPCMLTKMQTPDGRHAATHQTFIELTPKGWRKIPDIEDVDEETGEVRTVKCAKKIFGPAWLHGAHIPLWKGAYPGKLADLPAGVAVEASEGIEDGLSYAMADPTARVTAAGTLGLIGQMRLPPQCTQLNILAQRDTKETAIEALKDAIGEQQRRATREGVERVIACRWPHRDFNDWNEWLMAGAAV